jgi:hypothetical protein
MTITWPVLQLAFAVVALVCGVALLSIDAEGASKLLGVLLVASSSLTIVLSIRTIALNRKAARNVPEHDPDQA